MLLRSEEHHYCPHASLFIPPPDKWMWRGLSRYDPPQPDTAPPPPRPNAVRTRMWRRYFLWSGTRHLLASPSLSLLFSVCSLSSTPPPSIIAPLRRSSETGGRSGNKINPPRIDANTKRRDSLESSVAQRLSLFLPPGPSPSSGVGAPGHQQGSARQAGEGAVGLFASLAARHCTPVLPQPSHPGEGCGYPACFPHSKWTTPSVSMRT